MFAIGFVVAKLTDDERILVVSTKNCEVFYDEVKTASMYNIGIKRMKMPIVTKILFAPVGSARANLLQTPDFSTAEITASANFIESKTAFYNVTILSVFGKFSSASFTFTYLYLSTLHT